MDHVIGPAAECPPFSKEVLVFVVILVLFKRVVPKGVTTRIV